MSWFTSSYTKLEFIVIQKQKHKKTIKINLIHICILSLDSTARKHEARFSRITFSIDRMLPAPHCCKIGAFSPFNSVYLLAAAARQMSSLIHKETERALFLGGKVWKALKGTKKKNFCHHLQRQVSLHACRQRQDKLSSWWFSYSATHETSISSASTS